MQANPDKGHQRREAQVGHNNHDEPDVAGHRDVMTAHAGRHTICDVQPKPLPEFEVSVFTPEKAEALTRELALRRRQSRADWGLLFPRRGRVGSVVCGVLIAAMHILIVAPLLPASGHPRQETNAMGSVAGVDAEPAIQVTLSEEPPLALVPPPPTTAVTIQKPELPPLDPPPDVLKSFSDTLSEYPTIDAAGSSALAGRYLGQINARIERAWLKPRTPVATGVFHCQVRVEQDAEGKVLEIALEQCGADLRWQQSLVSAIESASPLPAPPDPKVFRKSLRLSFTGRMYSEQESAQEYEPPTANN